MDLRKLRHAVGLADAGSFSAAADDLAITQSALSRSIQSLEAELGQILFDRSAKGVRPTSAGAQLIPLARSLIRQSRDFERTASDLNAGHAGRVAIGFGPMFSHLPGEFIARCWASAPQVELQMHILPIERMIEMVLAEQLDFFVADSRSAQDHPELIVEPLADLTVGYHARTGHPLADGHWHDAAELHAYPLASPNLQQREGASAASSWNGHVACEMLEPLCDLARNGDAILLAMHFAIAADLDTGMLTTLKVRGLENWSSHVAVVRLSDRKLTPAARRYRDGARAIFAAHGNADTGGD